MPIVTESQFCRNLKDSTFVEGYRALRFEVLSTKTTACNNPKLGYAFTMTTRAKFQDRLPWYGWLLAPFVLPAIVVVAIPLGVLALFSIPYYLIFPDRHRHTWDFSGTGRQRELLIRWRGEYARVGLIDRIRRAVTRRGRRSPGRKEA